MQRIGAGIGQASSRPALHTKTMSISSATIEAGKAGWAWSPDPPQDLPPACYAIGDRVTSKWGNGTICGVEAWAMGDAGRAYNVHHDFSSAPPNFGHCFGEFCLQPLSSRRAEFPQDVDPAAAVPQLELFA
jgi:hypothetical protein